MKRSPNPSRLTKEQQKELEMLQKHTKLAMWPKMAKIQLNRPNNNKAVQNEPKRCLGEGKTELIYSSKGTHPPLFNGSNLITSTTHENMLEKIICTSWKMTITFRFHHHYI